MDEALDWIGFRGSFAVRFSNGFVDGFAARAKRTVWSDVGTKPLQQPLGRLVDGLKWKRIQHLAGTLDCFLVAQGCGPAGAKRGIRRRERCRVFGQDQVGSRGARVRIAALQAQVNPLYRLAQVGVLAESSGRDQLGDIARSIRMATI